MVHSSPNILSFEKDFLSLLLLNRLVHEQDLNRLKSHFSSLFPTALQGHLTSCLMKKMIESRRVSE
ncbi:hypothetical protein QQP08_026646, partial [Theobroma cacao]